MLVFTPSLSIEYNSYRYNVRERNVNMGMATILGLFFSDGKYLLTTKQYKNTWAGMEY